MFGFRSAWKSFTSVFSKPKSNDSEETPNVIERLADAVKKESRLLEPQSGPLPVYKIPLQEEDSAVKGCKCFRFGKESFERNRTIMVLGATGAGKSTLINGMINYVLGVEWNDPYRFKLVDEGQSTSQAHSQTTKVTTYKLNHRDGFKIENSLTIVDTPGFGDTGGIKKDKLIVEQLRDLFSAHHGVSEIDAVCFVAQASSARLTPTQKYVFDSVLSIFGKDVAENIRILVTFADGQRPPVLEAINAACVPCPKTKEGLPVHFKFNNSALFAQNKSCAAESASGADGDGDFDQMFWNMGIKSMTRFFSALNVMTTKSLTMTKDVLRERQQLEVSVQSLQKQVKIGLDKLEEIKETTTQLKDNEAEIRRNKDFVIKRKVLKAFQHDNSGSGTYLTNCQQCNFTCHPNCIYANDADKIRCSAMGSDGNCKQCPGKCIWSVHFNQKYRWEYREVTERITVKDLEKKYLDAKGAKMSVQALIDKLKAEYDLVHAQVVKVMGDSVKCLNRLKEIALRPNPLSTPEYIDMLIEGERAEHKSGWKTRVQYLMDMRGQAELMAKVDRGEELLQSSSSDFQSVPQGPTKDGADQDTTDTTNEKGDAAQNQDENDQDQVNTEEQDQVENDKDQVKTEDQDQDENDKDLDENDKDQVKTEDQDQDANDKDLDENDKDQVNTEDQDQDENDKDLDENDKDQVKTEDKDQDANDKDLDENDIDQVKTEDQDQDANDKDLDENDIDQVKTEDQDQDENDKDLDENDKDQVKTEDQDQDANDKDLDENDKDQVNTEDQDQDENDKDLDENDIDQVKTEDQDQDENDKDLDENDKDQVKTEDQDQDANDKDLDENDKDQVKTEDQDQDENDKDLDENDKDQVNTEDQDQDENDKDLDENDIDQVKTEDQDQDENDKDLDENDKDQVKTEDQDQDENDKDLDENDIDQVKTEDQDQDENDKDLDENDKDQVITEDQDQDENDKDLDENDIDQVKTEDQDQDENDKDLDENDEDQVNIENQDHTAAERLSE